MFPQFASTAATISRATALLTRVGTDAQIYDDPEIENFAVLLDSKYEAEKSEGMKRLIALMSQGKDVSNFFPQVVKNVVTQSLELKKLVYIYLVHYAEKRPDEALLAINTFQKDLSDLNPLVRAWALRAMSGIRVRVVLPLVVMAVTKCARDPSPYVRRCAAHAISKIYSLDHHQYLDELEELICFLMNDNSPGVIGAVAAAFTVVCPEKIYLWGARYEKLCEMLPNVDEWGQVVLIDILLRYVVGRHGYPEGCFGLSVDDKDVKQGKSKEEKGKGKMEEETVQVPDPQVPLKGGHRRKDETSSLFPEGSADFWLREMPDEDEIRDDKIPNDVQLLLKSTVPLFQSRNSAVVMAATGVHWVLASIKNVKKTVKPLLFLLRSSLESQYVVLANISTFVRKAPSLFEEHFKDFFIISTEPEEVHDMKLDILCRLATESSIHEILEEFQAYVRSPDHQFAANTVRAIGQCALRLPSITKACTEGLLFLARNGPGPPNKNLKKGGKEEQELPSKEKVSKIGAGKSQVMQKQAEAEKRNRESFVVAEAVMALRMIVHQHPIENEELLARLARGLDTLKVPAARGIVIWMVGEFGSSGTLVPQMVPVLLQYLGGTFTKEADEAKLQILNFAVKVVLRTGSTSEAARIPLLILDYVIRLAEQDLAYDIRDRARMYKHLLAFHLQNVPQQMKEFERERDTADRLRNLNIQQSSTDEFSNIKRSVGGDAQRDANPRSPGLDDGKDAARDRFLLMKLAQRMYLMPKPLPIFPSLVPDRSAFLPGSMSHIVQHRAPNYVPLPIPCSIQLTAPSSPVEKRLFGNDDVDQDSSSNEEYSGGGSDEVPPNRIPSPSSGSDDFYGADSAEIQSSNTPVSSAEDDQPRFTRRRVGKSKPQSHSSKHHSRSRRPAKGRPQKDLGPLINLLSDSDVETNPGLCPYEPEQSVEDDSLTGLGLLSPAEFDLWLGPPEQTKEEILTETTSGYATISIGKIVVKPKIYTLLDFTNGDGLDVKYCFERVVPPPTESLLSVKLYFKNRSFEMLPGIAVRHLDLSENSSEIGSMSVPGTTGIDDCIVVSEEKALELEPGGKMEGKLSVYFKGHLKPIKLSILCGGKSFPVKLTPDICALIRPVLLSPEDFSSAEARITGLHEALRRCTLNIPSQSEGSSSGQDQILLVARAVAQRVLNSAHVSFVSTIMPIVDSVLGVQAIKGGGLGGLCLRFSGETLTGPLLCLITVTILTESVISSDGGLRLEVMLKINCEDTMFGLSLLQELSKVLNSSD